MLLAGDESARSQPGNTNAYCQDREMVGSTGYSARRVRPIEFV